MKRIEGAPASSRQAPRLPAGSRRSWAALLLVAGCATASHADHVPDALRGCWIERRGADTITMRWFPADGLSWRGDLLHYTPGYDPEAQVFMIDATAGELEQFGWALCPQAEPTNPPCRALTFGANMENLGEIDYRAEIHAGGETLRLELVDGVDRTPLFNGQRDGCD